MKTRTIILTFLTAFAILLVNKTTLAEEKTKEYHEKWDASGVQSLEISNKFGEIKIKNEGGSEITIDVVITVDAPNESKANELLNDLNVSFRKTGNTVKAETSIANNFKSNRKFSINYEVNVPSDKNLTVSNKYGNTFVNKLNANGAFEIKYGNLTANQLMAPSQNSIKLDLAYGNASIDGTNNLDAIVAYSPLSVDVVQNLKIDSKYSQISVDKAGTVVAESKYDKYAFDAIESFTSTMKYSHVNIDRLSDNLKVDAGYGSVKVDEVSSGFSSISITNSYGQISLGLDEASYSIDASCSYCGISYPSDEFKGNRIKENNSTEINGQVGSATGGKIMIRSRYGDIKLND